MWCFVVLFTFLRTLSAPKLCVQHHYPVHIPFPSTQSWERNSLQQSALGQFCRTLWFTSFDSAAVRDAQGEFLYKPQGAHWFGWDSHRKWLVPVDVMAVTGLGTERPSPCPGAPASAFGSISWLQQHQWWEIPPSTPWAALQIKSSCPYWGDLWRTGVGFSWSSSTEGHQESFWLKTSWKAQWRREKEYVSFWF